MRLTGILPALLTLLAAPSDASNAHYQLVTSGNCMSNNLSDIMSYHECLQAVSSAWLKISNTVVTNRAGGRGQWCSIHNNQAYWSNTWGLPGLSDPDGNGNGPVIFYAGGPVSFACKRNYFPIYAWSPHYQGTLLMRERTKVEGKEITQETRDACASYAEKQACNSGELCTWRGGNCVPSKRAQYVSEEEMEDLDACSEDLVSKIQSEIVSTCVPMADKDKQCDCIWAQQPKEVCLYTEEEATVTSLAAFDELAHAFKCATREEMEVDAENERCGKMKKGRQCREAEGCSFNRGLSMCVATTGSKKNQDYGCASTARNKKQCKRLDGCRWLGRKKLCLGGR